MFILYINVLFGIYSFDFIRILLKVTAHTWAIFFPKNRFFSFFDIL